MKAITAHWLKRNHACSAKVRHFRNLFGERMEVNYENFEKWKDTQRHWRSDMAWLWHKIKCRADFERTVDKLADYLNLAPERRKWFVQDNVWAKIRDLRGKRFLHAMVQIIYMTR